MSNFNDRTKCNAQLLFGFFLFFARFEYALKASGYVRGMESRQKRIDGLKIAYADWKKFANDLKNDFSKNASPELAEAVEYIWENPPMIILVTENGEHLLEEPPLYDSRNFDFTRLLEFTRNVRNNLFHGGKHGDRELPQNTERNEKLLSSALIILNACLDLSTRVKTEFDTAII